MEKIKLKHLAPYLPHGLKMLNTKSGKIIDVIGLQESVSCIRLFTTDAEYQLDIWPLIPILRPLSDIDKEVNYGQQTYAVTDLFEIGDDGGYNYEFDNGNIKLIQQLRSMGKYNVYHDFNFMPYAVATELFERHFDVFGLIEQGLAVDINSI